MQIDTEERDERPENNCRQTFQNVSRDVPCHENPCVLATTIPMTRYTTPTRLIPRLPIERLPMPIITTLPFRGASQIYLRWPLPDRWLELKSGSCRTGFGQGSPVTSSLPDDTPSWRSQVCALSDVMTAVRDPHSCRPLNLNRATDQFGRVAASSSPSRWATPPPGVAGTDCPVILFP